MKLPPLSGKEAIKRLQKVGFVATRQRGSHVRLEKRSADTAIKLTVPLHPQLKRGTLLHILKDAGLSVEEFERLA